MMDSSERTHRNGSNSELFICFTSRLSSSSSSSMKISAKSILSPCRSRDPPVSLSTSLSRRLRTNGSLKGGQSPMFPTGGKKRGCSFENPEPSSPKVTCIGQVRVKTKKQGKEMRSLSKRRGSEVSFRRSVEQGREGMNHQSQTQNYQANANNSYQQQQQECLPHRNQRWVHLSLTICEAVRAFGAEFSCLFPCRPSCFSTSGRKKEEKATGSSKGTGQSSCGAVIARWLVSLQDGEGGKGREIELVVGGEEERTETRERTLSLRRHVVEEIEIKDEKCEVKDGVGEEEEARVSICIPPKNALLLMRCRSDPMRMSALTNSIWESPAQEEEDDDDREDKEEDREEGHEDVQDAVLIKGDMRLTEDKEVEMSEKLVSSEASEEQENPEAESYLVMEVHEAEEKENQEEKLEINEELQEEDEEKQEPVVQDVNIVAEAEENEVTGSLSEALADPENLENEEVALQLTQEEEEEEEEERKASHYSSSVVSVRSLSEDEQEVEAEALAEEAALEEEAEEKSTEEKETPLKEEEETVTQERSESEETHEGEGMEESEERERESHAKVERESEVKKKQERESSSVLPDCLLLMMCEPKLSMEVSKETWVCSTDFIRWLPERPVNTTDGGDDPKKRISTDSNPALPQQNPPHHPLPPRSSCSLPAPAAVSMATMIEQKLVNAVAYEPFVLTRCKSEPMRTAAAKLAPDTCFWKNRKLEPLRRATFGVGAAGIGF